MGDFMEFGQSRKDEGATQFGIPIQGATQRLKAQT
jgi:hypothetical protein